MDRDDGRPLNVLDVELARLRERFPAWRVWWIRDAVSRAVSWHAQPSRFPWRPGPVGRKLTSHESANLWSITMPLARSPAYSIPSGSTSIAASMTATRLTSSSHASDS